MNESLFCAQEEMNDSVKKIIEIYEMGSYAYLAALALGLTIITTLIIGIVFALTRKRAAVSVAA